MQRTRIQRASFQSRSVRAVDAGRYASLVDSSEEVMSICVDYFFNHQSELLILGQELNAWLGSSLAAQEADLEELFCRFLGMELSLSEHPFENDRELTFQGDSWFFMNLKRKNE